MESGYDQVGCRYVRVAFVRIPPATILILMVAQPANTTVNQWLAALWLNKHCFLPVAAWGF